VHLPSGWHPRLRQADPPVTVLVTIAGLGGVRDQAAGHPALLPGALRFSVTPAHVTSAHATGTIPFWPLLAAWPDLRLRISPHERRAEITEAKFTVLADADFPYDRLGKAGLNSLVCRVDLWMPGLTLEETVGLLFGPADGAVSGRRFGRVEFTAQDRPTKEDVSFNPGPFDLADFPEAPPFVSGFEGRWRRVLGLFANQVPLVQIDKDGQRFYLMDGAPLQNPRRYFVGGIELTTEAEKPSIHVVPFPSDPTRVYTEVRFREPIRQTGIMGFVTASEFVTVDGDRPITALLTDSALGAYELDPETAGLLAATERDFAGLQMIASEGNILSVVTDRLLPQTDLLMHWRLGRARFYKLLDDGPERSVALGQGLIHRTDGGQLGDDVWNVLEVAYTRNFLAPIEELKPKDSIPVDRSYGGSVGALLAASERAYGRRLRPTINALDLVSADANVAVPPGARRLAELEARLHAFDHSLDVYAATYEWAMAQDLNYRYLLTDPDEGYVDKAVRLVGWQPLPGVVAVTFQSEDADA